MSRSKRSKGKVVFSTSGGDQRNRDDQPAGPSRSLPPQQQNLKIMRDKKGRRGKIVTVIAGFTLTEDDLNTLAKQLKSQCGAGGTTKNGSAGEQIIEVQGDHRDKVAEVLTEQGYKVKFSGG